MDSRNPQGKHFPYEVSVEIAKAGQKEGLWKFYIMIDGMYLASGSGLASQAAAAKAAQDFISARKRGLY